MEIFLDTANVKEIKNCIESGCIKGITTNPTIISREKKTLSRCISDIRNVAGDLLILVEVISDLSSEMVKEAREYVKMGPEMIIKLPMTKEGLEAAGILAKENIRTAVTLVFSLSQAIAASCAGADYVAPFIGRIEDAGFDGLDLIRSIRKTFDNCGAKTKIIGASIRSPRTAAQLFESGCDIVTVPGKVFEAMLVHPLTDKGLEKFKIDLEGMPKYF